MLAPTQSAKQTASPTPKLNPVTLLSVYTASGQLASPGSGLWPLLYTPLSIRKVSVMRLSSHHEQWCPHEQWCHSLCFCPHGPVIPHQLLLPVSLNRRPAAQLQNNLQKAAAPAGPSSHAGCIPTGQEYSHLTLHEAAVGTREDARSVESSVTVSSNMSFSFFCTPCRAFWSSCSVVPPCRDLAPLLGKPLSLNNAAPTLTVPLQKSSHHCCVTSASGTNENQTASLQDEKKKTEHNGDSSKVREQKWRLTENFECSPRKGVVVC